MRNEPNETLAQPQRLFDCIQWQLDNFPLEDMLAAKEEGKWRKYSTAEVQKLTNEISAALLEKGISAGDGTPEGRDKIGIISPNRPEWMIADIGIQQAGAVSVPVYPNITDNELGFILENAGVQIVFVADRELYDKVEKLRPSLPLLKEVYSFDELDGVSHWASLTGRLSSEAKERVEATRAGIKGTDLATILYTSGTTGTPKGVMLSHHNILSNVFGSAEIIQEIGIEGKRTLSFLPLNHAFERMATYCFIYSGVSIYYPEGLEHLAQNLKEVKPTLFTSVPRVLEKVYESIVSKGNELKGAKKKLFFWALDLAERYEIDTTPGLGYRIQLAIADKLIFSKWREALGGEIKAIIAGAAAMQVRLLRIFTAAGIVIQEGYGLTEASPIISGNRYPKSGRKFGTVGPLLSNVEVKIAEDREILCKGPNVMLGYFKRPDLTAEVMQGEWLKTGDIGQMIDGKFLKITDRKKELLKTSGGKYVAPQPIENKMAESRWIEQIMVVGDFQKFVGALIVPAFHSLKNWYEGQGKPYPGDEAVVEDEEAITLIDKDVKEFNKLFNPVEQVKKIRLLTSEWSIEGGELTPTMKLKRRNISEKYQGVIESMYSV